MRQVGPVRAVGAVSGATLGGVKAAVVVTDGVTVEAFEQADTRPYSEEEQALLRAAAGRWPGEAGVQEAAELVETATAELLARFDAVELAGFAGHRLAHEPRGRGSHAAGDGAVLAEVLGLPVIWDFRASDMELGGQGAPMAAFFHHALARRIGAEEPIGFLHLGATGSLTWVDPRKERPEAAGALLAFETGPGVAALDTLLRARRGLAMDQDGDLAKQGKAEEAVVAGVLRDPFFRRIPPKALATRDFSGLLLAVAGLSDADAAATLTEAVAAAQAAALEHLPGVPQGLLVSGGGRLNPALMAALRARVPCPVLPVEEAGLDGDMLAAQAWAFLAVRVLRGLPTSCQGSTGVAAAVGGGQVSRPGR